ncbi:hypothetical protein [Texcoconibacillus texcoconensis]|uniref:Uncharacterized protein n=1 Tax=Texcoconibacillus texcoconensis TaxID=1095777 RepID=A0A840QUI2_9BACI|nr:hypothetical protein [Texcoconibacillus texcoconensis]MBB5175045.1 hypothetical protein [Texcoconibacillus texcoconensis]
MKNISTVTDLLEYFISEEEIQKIAQKYGYHDTAYKFTLVDFINFWLVSASEKWVGFRDAESKLGQKETSTKLWLHQNSDLTSIPHLLLQLTEVMPVPGCSSHYIVRINLLLFQFRTA